MNTPAALEPYQTSGSPQTPGVEPRNQEPKSRWWVWLLLLAVLGYGGYRLYQIDVVKKAKEEQKKERKRPHDILIVPATAHTGDMPIYLRGLGSVTAFNTVTVKSRVDGQLINVTFREGQLVNKGDILAELDPRPLQVALDQALGTLAKDEATLQDAQVNLERYRALFNEQIIAKQQFDTQASMVNQFKGSIEADKAAIDNAKLQLSFTKIVAPISGRIGLRQVDSGNMIHAADVTGIAIITQLQPIAVLFNLPEEQLPPVLRKLYAGQKLPVEAYARNASTKIATGTLETVDNQIDQTTGTSRLKAIFANTDNALFPNQFVNTKLLLDTRRGAVIVPMAAIQRGPIGTYVYLINDDRTVAVRQVKLGPSEGNDVIIEEGLKSGDAVVVEGADKLTEGMKVNTRPASDVERRPQE